MNRRKFLQITAAAPAAAAATHWPLSAWAAAEGSNAWRMFEVTTKVELLKPSGVSKIWLPVPLLNDRDFHKTLGNTWSAPGGEVRYTAENKYGMGIVAAEIPASVEKPVVTLVSRFATRDRAVDISKPSGASAEDPAVLKLNLQPTELIPTDGIVRETARDIIKGVKGGDIDKARAIYEWVVDNTFRDAKVRGCFMPSVFPPVEAGSIAELARMLELPVGALEATVARFNAAVQPGSFDHTALDDCRTDGLTPEKTHWAQRIDTPPFLGYPLRPGITFTYLGVKVNEKAQVIMANGVPTANLFAAGEIMAGSILGQGYLAGFGMTIGAVFGRLAGTGAATHARH